MTEDVIKTKIKNALTKIKSTITFVGNNIPKDTGFIIKRINGQLNSAMDDLLHIIHYIEIKALDEKNSYELVGYYHAGIFYCPKCVKPDLVSRCNYIYSNCVKSGTKCYDCGRILEEIK